MLDHRIHTFLKLCQVMNYHETARLLNMTQPAVTQHIRYLEQAYGCTLFEYDGRKLARTQAAETLLRYARAAAYNEGRLAEAIRTPQRTRMRVGATKTIGAYVVFKENRGILYNERYEFSLRVDNTARLLALLEAGELDFALIEGYYDKQIYEGVLFREEPFVGICARDNPLAGREAPLEALFDQTLLVREPGSGTREVLERVLRERSYSLESFCRRLWISDLEQIAALVAGGVGISFVYAALAAHHPELATFTLAGRKMSHEFSYVFLPGTEARTLIRDFEAAQAR